MSNVAISEQRYKALLGQLAPAPGNRGVVVEPAPAVVHHRDTVTLTSKESEILRLKRELAELKAQQKAGPPPQAPSVGGGVASKEGDAPADRWALDSTTHPRNDPWQLPKYITALEAQIAELETP